MEDLSEQARKLMEYNTVSESEPEDPQPWQIKARKPKRKATSNTRSPTLGTPTKRSKNTKVIDDSDSETENPPTKTPSTDQPKQPTKGLPWHLVMYSTKPLKQSLMDEAISQYCRDVIITNEKLTHTKLSLFLKFEKQALG